jgi:hypothetical protein
VTPQYVPERVERAICCTAQELTSWLPVAFPLAQLKVESSAHLVQARFPDGALTITWQPLEPRRVASLETAQLAVRFQYGGLGATSRSARDASIRRCSREPRANASHLRKTASGRGCGPSVTIHGFGAGAVPRAVLPPRNQDLGEP